MSAVPELTLGPIPYHWPAERKLDFYAQIADEAPVGTVYLGETICSKRSPFFDHHYDEVAERLRRGGKTVVFSTLAEVLLKRERKDIEALAGLEDYEIEINNAAGLFYRSGRPHRVGPFMNVYNEETLGHLVQRGATHACLPSEMPRASVARMAAAGRELGAGIEVQVFGRASLAVSARCYHARAHGRTKDNCQFVCEEDPDGMPLSTIGGRGFLRVNGIQTQSESYINLVRELPDMAALGVTHVRLMPQAADMVAVARAFDAVLTGAAEPAAAEQQLQAMEIGAPFANGFWHGVAGHRHVEPVTAGQG